MTPADLAAIARTIGPLMREYGAKVHQDAMAQVGLLKLQFDAEHQRNVALEMRILELETRPAVIGPQGEQGLQGERGERGEKGLDGAPGERGLQGERGKDADQVDVEALVARVASLVPAPLNGKDGATGAPGRDGKDAPPVDEDAIVARVTAAIPVPKDGIPGKDGRDADPVDVDAMVARVTAAIPVPKDGADGRDGKDAPPVDVDAIVTRVAALVPTPKDGINGRDGKDAEPVDVDAVVQRVKALIPTPANGIDGSEGKAGRDGIGIAAALIDRSGHLILTMSDGAAKDVGVVVGKDGAEGVNGRDADPREIASLVKLELSSWPRPKDGKDGVDGLGIDDAELVHDQRGWFLRLINTTANRVKDLAMPFLWDAGVWVAGATYAKGAGATWDGQFWIAQKETSVQPTEGIPDWRLAVRRGGRGKDGKPGKDFTPPRNNTPPLYGG